MQFLAALIMSLFQGGTPPARVQLGAVVRPETTTVGEHFAATVRIRVPVGSTVRFPAQPDSSAQVDSAGATTRADTTIGGFTESTVKYVLAAWDTGAQRLGIDSVTVSTAGVERTVSLGRLDVYVRSVLPADTALRKPKPFRPVIAITPFNWLRWLIAAAVAALLAIGIIAWRRWRRRVALGLTPLQIAQRDFARIDARALVESGEYERYAIEMAAVVRVYLASVVPSAARSATTHELAVSLAGGTVVPVDRLIAVLDASDILKFARGRSSAERAVEIGAEARRIVADTSAALEARAAAIAKAA